MSDLITVGAVGIRSKLIQVPELVAIVTQSGQAKVFLEAAEGLSDAPYILMRHIWGGDLNNAPSQAFDMLWRVDCVARTLPEARELSGMTREALHRQQLTYPDGWVDWSKATVTGNFLEPLTIQGVQFWATGPFVRLRGSKPA